MSKTLIIITTSASLLTGGGSPGTVYSGQVFYPSYAPSVGTWVPLSSGSNATQKYCAEFEIRISDNKAIISMSDEDMIREFRKFISNARVDCEVKQ